MTSYEALLDSQSDDVNKQPEQEVSCEGGWHQDLLGHLGVKNESNKEPESVGLV